MPQIHEYTAQTEVRGPAEERLATSSGAGEAISKMGEQVSSMGAVIHKRDVMREDSEMSVKLADVNARKAEDWETNWKLDARAATDKDWKNKFEEKWAPELDKIGENLQTSEVQNRFAEQRAALDSRFKITTMQDQSAIVGEATGTGLNQTVDLLANSTLSIPSHAEANRVVARMKIDAAVADHKLDQKHANELYKAADARITIAEIQGLIRSDTSTVPEKSPIYQKLTGTSDWDKYINSEEKNGLINLADRNARANDLQARQNLDLETKARDKLRKDNFDLSVRDIFGGKFNKSVIFSRDMDGAQYENLMALQERQITKKFSTNKELFESLNKEVLEGTYRPDSYYVQFYGEGLDQRAYQTLLRNRDSNLTEAGRARNKTLKVMLDNGKSLDGSNAASGFKDPVGSERKAEYNRIIDSKYVEAIKAGATPEETQDPKSKFYIDHRAIKNQLTPSIQEKIDAIIQQTGVAQSVYNIKTGVATYPAPIQPAQKVTATPTPAPVKKQKESFSDEDLAVIKKREQKTLVNGVQSVTHLFQPGDVVKGMKYVGEPGGNGNKKSDWIPSIKPTVTQPPAPQRPGK